MFSHIHLDKNNDHSQMISDHYNSLRGSGGILLTVR